MMLYAREEQSPFTTGRDGVLEARKDPDSIERFVLDWSDKLDTDTIATAVWSREDGNVSISDSSNTDVMTSVTVAKADGTIKCVVTTEAGYVYVRRLRFVERKT